MVDETRISSPSNCGETKWRVIVATVCNGATNPGLICHPHNIRCAHLPSAQDQMCSIAIRTRIRCAQLPSAQGSDALTCHPHRDQMCSSAIRTGSDVLNCHPHKDQMCSIAIRTGIRCAHLPSAQGSDVLTCHPHKDQMCSPAIRTGSDVHSGDTTTKRVSEIIGKDRYVLILI